jgi:hypothetical protein
MREQRTAVRWRSRLLPFAAAVVLAAGCESRNADRENASESVLRVVADSLRGFKLGQPLKVFQQADTAWVLLDHGIAARREARELSGREPATLYRRLDVPNKQPRIDLVGDDADLEYAHIQQIQLFYLNYDRMGIRREDFIVEMERQWGRAHHHSTLQEQERLLWLNAELRTVGELIFEPGPWGPRMLLTLTASTDSSATGRYSRQKANAVLRAP